MGPFARVIWIVLDSVGIGALPDAADYDDVGRSTLAHIAESRALQIPHALDFVELASYGADSETGGHARIRFLKDLDTEIGGRDVLIVEDVVDTGLTLNYLCKVLRLRAPRSLAAVTLLDRPYRRLVEDLPVRYVGFTVFDELFVGYGFDLQERYRNLFDLHVLES